MTPSAAKTRALWICGAMSHMPPVGPRGKTSWSETSQASMFPVFWRSRAKSPHCPRFIVAGPVLSMTSAGAEIVSGGEMPFSPGSGS